MEGTRENDTVAGSHNDIYAAQAGEGPGPELAGEETFDEKEDEKKLDKSKGPMARQEGQATIKSNVE